MSGIRSSSSSRGGGGGGGGGSRSLSRRVRGSARGDDRAHRVGDLKNRSLAQMPVGASERVQGYNRVPIQVHIYGPAPLPASLPTSSRASLPASSRAPAPASGSAWPLRRERGRGRAVAGGRSEGRTLNPKP